LISSGRRSRQHHDDSQVGSPNAANGEEMKNVFQKKVRNERRDRRPARKQVTGVGGDAAAGNIEQSTQ